MNDATRCTIELSESRSGSEDILRAFGPVDDWRECQQLKVSFPDEVFIYPGGVATLTALLCFAEHRGAELAFDFGDEGKGIEGYLSRMDFFRHLGLEHPEDFDRHSSGARFIPLHAVHEWDDAGEPVNRLCDAAIRLFDNARDFLPALEWAINEITDNIINHAESPVPGFVFAQFYPEKSLLSVAIVDAGRGLRASLSEAFEVSDDAEALRLAIERGVTRGFGQGNGIAGTREILRECDGRFAIWSGTKYLYTEWTDGEPTERVSEVPKAPGTGLSMQFRTDRAIDLGKTFIEGAEDYSYTVAVAASLDEGKALRVADESSHTGARAPATRLRHKIENLLPDLERPLQLDFEEVESVSSSFADELLGKLIADLGTEAYERRVRLLNVDDSVRKRIDVVANQRLDDS